MRTRPWGRSSAGRASQWHCEGQGFDPPRLHHRPPARQTITRSMAYKARLQRSPALASKTWLHARRSARSKQPATVHLSVSVLVPTDRALRIAALTREVEAVPLGGITRIVEVELRHKVAERLDLPARIISLSAGRALSVGRIVQPRKGAT